MCRLPKKGGISLDVRECIRPALPVGIRAQRLETLPARAKNALERLGIPTREFAAHN
jgi:hypothetical protein